MPLLAASIGCSSVTRPIAELAAADNSLANADEARAAAQSPLPILRNARDKIGAAKQVVDDDEEVRADADLADAQARAKAARRSVDELRVAIEEVRREARLSAGRGVAQPGHDPRPLTPRREVPPCPAESHPERSPRGSPPRARWWPPPAARAARARARRAAHPLGAREAASRPTRPGRVRRSAGGYRQGCGRGQRGAKHAKVTHLAYVANKRIDIAVARADERAAQGTAEAGRPADAEARNHELQSHSGSSRRARPTAASCGRSATCSSTSTARPCSSARASLEKLVTLLNESRDRTVDIEGHTDSTGSRQHNEELSQARSLAFDFPVASNDSAGGRQLKRRVEIILANGAGGTTRAQRFSCPSTTTTTSGETR